MLMEIGMADAYGVGFEFIKQDKIKEKHTLIKYYDSSIDDLKAGQYSDDTQMSIAIAEFMLEEIEWNQYNLAKKFLEVFHRELFPNGKPRPGYAGGFYNFMMENKTPEDFIANIKNDSIRNGAAMRSVPLSIIKNIEELKEKAKIQAMVTHNSIEGIHSSQAVALIGNYFLYQNGNKENILEYINNELEENYINNKTDRVACDAKETIDAVITILESSSSLLEVLDKSIKLGGDTDSVAAIAVGLASLSKQYKSNLPNFLYENLEDGKFGKKYLLAIDVMFNV